jgi:hypothetical protein
MVKTTSHQTIVITATPRPLTSKVDYANLLAVAGGLNQLAPVLATGQGRRRLREAR